MFLQVRAHGPGLAGALFGAGWCFWVDAVLVNAQHGHKLPFLAVRVFTWIAAVLHIARWLAYNLLQVLCWWFHVL